VTVVADAAFVIDLGLGGFGIDDGRLCLDM
jgi:hypothetical protein